MISTRHASRLRAGRVAWLIAAQLAMVDVPAAEETTMGCDAPEYRALDFKLGRFDVTTAAGEPAGSARVETVLQGCLMIEHWSGAQGGDGRAHIYYDAAAGIWHLRYINVDGETLELRGALTSDLVSFVGEASFYGMRGLHRMSWVEVAEGRVEQTWDLSADGGATWQPVFRGVYRRID